MNYHKPAEDLLMEIQKSIGRRNLMKLIFIAILLGVAVGGCDFQKFDASAETNSKEENNMGSIQSTSNIQHQIPPIDASVLPETETATFALG